MSRVVNTNGNWQIRHGGSVELLVLTCGPDSFRKKYLRTKVPHLRTNEGTKVHVIKNKASCYHLPVIDYMCINNTKVVYLHIISHIHTYITHTYGINNSNPPPLYFGLPPGNANETRIFTAYGENPF